VMNCKLHNVLLIPVATIVRKYPPMYMPTEHVVINACAPIKDKIYTFTMLVRKVILDKIWVKYWERKS
jgi:hypothetical protein